MPSAKWHVDGQLSASVLDPVDVKIKEVFWDSQKHTLHAILDRCALPESTTVVIEIHGISSGSKDQCAGPGEVVGVHAGDDQTVPEMELVLHNHWHSFVVGHQGLEAAKVVDTLKQFDTSPAKLWEVLEYTSLLYDMYKSPRAENLSLTDLNRLIAIVCGEGKKMSSADWNSLCRNMGAKALVGLTRRQFSCCWYDVVGLSSHNAKDVYVRLHTAERLFEELVTIFQDSDEQDVINEETIEKLARFAGFPDNMLRKALKDLREKKMSGWDGDTFAQIVCGSHPIVKFSDDAMSLWMKLYYSKKLFNAYSTKKLIRKKNLTDLLAAARVTKPKLTNELWMEICDSVGIDDTGGLKYPEFLSVYASDMLGSRHAVADWYRIETFKLLPDRRVKEEATKEAVLNVAPEKVNVKDVAAKALEETASAEELFQDLLEKGLEFSKLDVIEERVSTTFGFESSFVAKHYSRDTGFLNIQVRSITELADRLIAQDTSFNKENAAEELYMCFEITTSQGLRFRLPEHSPRGRCRVVLDTLFGEDARPNNYVVKEDEYWDQGKTQARMRAMHEAEKALKACKPQTPEFQAALAKLKLVERQLIPWSDKHPNGKVGFNGKVFSSLILRDPSPDAIIRFPNDHIRLFVDIPDDGKPLYVVCKLFKRIGCPKSQLMLKLQLALEAHQKAEATHAILLDLVEQQQAHLRHVIADTHADTDTVKDTRIWNSVSKLKQKRKDLEEFEVEVKKCKDEVERLTAELQRAVEKQEQTFMTLQELQDRAMVASAALAQENTVITPDGPLTNDGSKSSKKQARKEARAEAKKESKAAKQKREIEAQLAQLQKELDTQKVKFIGQAFFEVGDLLNVLHDDKEQTEDLAVFRTEEHDDVGVLLLHFQYKCASMSMDSPAVKLPSLTITATGETKKRRAKEKAEKMLADKDNPADAPAELAATQVAVSVTPTDSNQPEDKDASPSIVEEKTINPESPEVEATNQEDEDTEIDEDYEEAFVYPSHAHLELEWKSDTLVFRRSSLSHSGER
ncbi:hypothetical protein PINS_up001739 [Pythium insidiosum]|nr:hypothetical protein PINS_up001739 [Pythium insidiosum]